MRRSRTLRCTPPGRCLPYSPQLFLELPHLRLSTALRSDAFHQTAQRLKQHQFRPSQPQESPANHPSLTHPKQGLFARNPLRSRHSHYPSSRISSLQLISRRIHSLQKNPSTSAAEASLFDHKLRATVFFGMRGETDLEMTVYGPARPMHTGNDGNWVPNPIALLTHLLDRTAAIRTRRSSFLASTMM